MIYPASHHRATRRAFTLVELLAVIAIIGILGAIVFAAMGSLRTRSQISTSANNLRQLGAAALIFAADNKQMLPVYYHDHPTYKRHGWIRAVWELTYHPRPVPRVTPIPDTDVGFRKEWGDTIFLSPLLEEGANVRSYGFNKYLCRYTGGDPTSLTLSPMSLNEILNPARTAMIGDSQRSIELRRDTNPTGRNDGWVLLVFVDGHVDRLLPPQSGINNPSPAEKRMPYNRDNTFWRGTATAPDNRAITVW